MDIIRIDPFYIDEHPRHEGIFGPATVDPGFVDSIRERGVLQPCIITPQDGFDDDDPHRRYWMIAGRRRMAGFVEAYGEPGQRWEAPLADMPGKGGGLPCYVKVYDGEDDLVVDLIVSNKHRLKTEKQIVDEVEVLLAIYGKEAAERQRRGKKVTSAATAADGNVGKTSEIVAEHLGLSRARVERLITVFSDAYRSAFVETLKKARPKQLQALLKNWDNIREKRLLDQISLSAAEREILNLKIAMHQVVNPKEGQRVLTKPKLPALKFRPRESCGLEDMERSEVYGYEFDFGEVEVCLYAETDLVISVGEVVLVLDEVTLRMLAGPQPARPNDAEES